VSCVCVSVCLCVCVCVWWHTPRRISHHLGKATRDTHLVRHPGHPSLPLPVGHEQGVARSQHRPLDRRSFVSPPLAAVSRSPIFISLRTTSVPRRSLLPPLLESLDHHHHGPLHRKGMLGVATADGLTAAISVAVHGWGGGPQWHRGRVVELQSPHSLE
jgi:hypothetical protein